jgi:uncharacterized protein YndB with AHSA1/START domain
VRSLCAPLLLLAISCATARPASTGSAAPAPLWAWVSDSHCGTGHAKPGGEDCVRKCYRGGADVGHPEWLPQKLVLVREGSQSLLVVDNPEQVLPYAGRKVQVTVRPAAGESVVHVLEVLAVQPAPLIIRRAFSASPERLWRAWTEEAELTAWLAARARVTLEAGGPYELFWEPEHPERNSTLGCRLTAVEPHRRLAFTWRGPPAYAELMNVGEPPPTRVEVSFEPRGEKTVMHFVHSGWGEGQRWEEARTWQERAWLGAFEALERHLTGAGPAP